MRTVVTQVPCKPVEAGAGGNHFRGSLQVGPFRRSLRLFFLNAGIAAEQGAFLVENFERDFALWSGLEEISKNGSVGRVLSNRPAPFELIGKVHAVSRRRVQQRQLASRRGPHQLPQ